MTKRQATRLVSFVLLAVLMLAGVTNLLRDKDTTLSSLYSEPNNTVDVFAVGSSHVNSAVVPAVLWQEYGISAHNVFSWSQPMWISYYYIKEAMRTQQPSAVVLDLYGMLYGNSGEQPKEIDDTNYKNSFQIDPGLNFLAMTQTVGSCGIDLRNPVDFLNLVRFHTRWKYLTEKNFTYNPHKDKSYLKGYGPQMRTQPTPAPAAYPDAAVQPRAPYDTAVRWLQKIVALCKEKQVPLVFMLTPYAYQPAEREIFAWLEQYAAENGVPMLNYCGAAGAEIKFDYETQMSDATHLNYKGAFALTRHLGAYLKQTLTLPDAAKNKNAAALAKDAGKVYRVIEVNEQLSQDPATYLARLAQDENAVVFACAFGDNTALGASMQKGLAQLDTAAPEKLAHKDAGYVAVRRPDGPRRWRTQSVADGEVSHQEELGGHRFLLHSDGDKTAGGTILVDGKDPFVEFGANAQLRFAVYDLVLERPTFYFYYDAAQDQLMLRDFPDKAQKR